MTGLATDEHLDSKQKLQNKRATETRFFRAELQSRFLSRNSSIEGRPKGFDVEHGFTEPELEIQTSSQECKYQYDMSLSPSS